MFRRPSAGVIGLLTDRESRIIHAEVHGCLGGGPFEENLESEKDVTQGSSPNFFLVKLPLYRRISYLVLHNPLQKNLINIMKQRTLRGRTNGEIQ